MEGFNCFQRTKPAPAPPKSRKWRQIFLRFFLDLAGRGNSSPAGHIGPDTYCPYILLAPTEKFSHIYSLAH